MRFAAGRGAVADRLVRGAALAELLLAGNRRHRGLPAGAPWQSKGTAVAERHREDVAYCGTAAAEPAGRLAGAPRRSKGAAARLRHGTGAAVERGRRQCAGIAAEHERLTKCQRRCGAVALAESKSWRAGRQILSDSPSDLAITSAAQVLPYVFTAVRGISQSC